MKIQSVVLCISLWCFSSYCLDGKSCMGAKGGVSLYQARETFSNDADSFSYYYEYQPKINSILFLEYLQNKLFTHSVFFQLYQAGGKQRLDEYQNGQFVGHFWNAIDLNYLSAGYNPIFKLPVKMMIPYFATGLSFDYLISKQQYWIMHGRKEKVDVLDIDEFNRINFRIILTGGIEYDLGRIGMLGEYSFSYNLLPYISKKGDASQMQATTNGHLINIGFKFKI